MRCYVEAIDRRDREEQLRRCGCNRCYEEYNRMQQSDRYAERRRHEMRIDYGRSPAFDTINMLNKELIVMTETTPKPTPAPITNPAIKTLVDALRSVVSSRNSSAELLECRKKDVAIYGKQVEETDVKIAAFTKALKKLGHKFA